MDKNRSKVIEELRKLNIEFNPSSQIKTLKGLLKEAKSGISKENNDDVEENVEEEVIKNDNSTKLNETLSALTSLIGSMEARLAKLEGGESKQYRTEAKKEDIEKASEMKKDIDPRIVKIVEESLGTDFGIEVKPFADRPGFQFTLIVPQRLSDNVSDSRPLLDESTGLYKKDGNGNTVFEPYFPEDRRSRVIGSMQSFDAIKDHCDKVRSYIVSYYQKTRQPLPEFKLK